MKFSGKHLFNFKKCGYKEKGFTLIELIAVIAILGILASVLVVNIVAYINKAKATRIVSDCGVIIRAIDAYEAEHKEDTTAYVYSDYVHTDNEFSVYLDEIYHLDATNHHIIGANAAIKDLSPYFKKDADASSDKIVHIRISYIRGIAKRDVTVVTNPDGTIKSYKGKAYGAGGIIDNSVNIAINAATDYK